ncbi:MAG: hypothetical protein AAF485_21675 [Chloroflexota bacterium]
MANSLMGSVAEQQLETTHTIFPGLEYRHEAGTDILSWSNRKVPRHMLRYLSL